MSCGVCVCVCVPPRSDARVTVVCSSIRKRGSSSGPSVGLTGSAAARILILIHHKHVASVFVGQISHAALCQCTDSACSCLVYSSRRSFSFSVAEQSRTISAQNQYTETREISSLVRSERHNAGLNESCVDEGDQD